MTGVTLPTIVEEVVCRISVTGATITSTVTFRYDPADPWAVTLTIRDSEGVKVWWVARELFRDGLRTRVGVGDIRVRPHRARSGAWLALDMSSPDGAAIVAVPADAVAGFVHRMSDLVPFGDEGRHLDVGAALAAQPATFWLFRRGSVNEFGWWTP